MGKLSASRQLNMRFSFSPTSRLLRGLAGWTLLGLVPAVWPELTGFWLLVSGLLLVVAAWDAALLRRRPPLTVERAIAPVLPLGLWRAVRLRVVNTDERPAALTLFDHYPTAAAEIADLPQQLTVEPGGWAELTYRLRPVVRGEWTFAPAQVLLESPRGWWRRDDRLGEPECVRIYPNFAIIAQDIRLTVDRREALLGIHRRRRRGEGQTFLQLREYRIGDSLRQIDWKATARMRKPIAKDYQDERNQTVLFLLDCGRRMRAQDDDLSHFDHALNALILLAYVALRQGDAVGLQSFGGERRWLAPRTGPGMLATLINGVYDLQPGLEPPDYADVAQRTLTRQRKRALIVLLTNLRDEDQDELRPAVALLRRRHLVLIGNLREPVLDELLARPIRDLAQARLYATTCHYLLHRERVQEELRQQGGIVLDVPPDKLPAAMVNQYLDLKRGGRL
ncbi:MAG: DUF58 domain-containing protein [Candidatus Contendobacter sp.]|nr:DUF58 domain-containing protein [Candidatus Contendobacter sp.]MDG4559388.1 DUF58 domain-containing protein [Candidatus Contendobacter sp.]